MWCRYPLFHRPSLLRRLEAREYLTNQSFSAVILGLCALAAARARDGALSSHGWNPEYFKNPLAEVYFTAADEVMRRGVSKMMALGEGLDWMRACALLALYGIQIGEEGIAHQYLGMYHSLVSIDGLQDEKNWPKHIGIVETELRRRLVSVVTLMQLEQQLMHEVLVNVLLRSLLLGRLGKDQQVPGSTISGRVRQRNRGRGFLGRWIQPPKFAHDTPTINHKSQLLASRMEFRHRTLSDP
jgi:hypothetical protein